MQFNDAAYSCLGFILLICVPLGVALCPGTTVIKIKMALLTFMALFTVLIGLTFIEVKRRMIEQAKYVHQMKLDFEKEQR